MKDLASTLATWPRRRFVALAALVPLLAVVFALTTSLVTRPDAAGWEWPLLLVNAVLAAGVLASYLPAPGTGRRLDVGCEPCAVMAAIGVLAALVLRSSAPADPAQALISVAVLLMAARARLTDTGTCRTAPPPLETPATDEPSAPVRPR